MSAKIQKFDVQTVLQNCDVKGGGTESGMKAYIELLCFRAQSTKIFLRGSRNFKRFEIFLRGVYRPDM